MKIIHFVRHFHPNLGGVEKHVLNVAKEQLRLGFKVEIITWQSKNMSEYEFYDGIKIYRTPAMRSPMRNKLWHLQKMHKYASADILHFHNLDTFEFVPFLRLMRPKIVLTLHGWGGVFPIPETHKNRVQKTSVKYASSIITVGHFVNKWYEISSNAIIYGAVDDALFTSNKSTPTYDICIFGRLEIDAGIPVYTAALKKLIHEMDRTLKICIVGNGSQKTKLIEALQGADTEFVGFVENTQEYIKKSHICFTSGYLGILECLAARSYVCSVFDNELKEDYLKLSPFAQYINITDNRDELAEQTTSLLFQEKNANSEIPIAIRSLNWCNLVQVYECEYRKILTCIE